MAMSDSPWEKSRSTPVEAASGMASENDLRTGCHHDRGPQLDLDSMLPLTSQLDLPLPLFDPSQTQVEGAFARS